MVINDTHTRAIDGGAFSDNKVSPRQWRTAESQPLHSATEFEMVQILIIRLMSIPVKPTTRLRYISLRRFSSGTSIYRCPLSPEYCSIMLQTWIPEATVAAIVALPRLRVAVRHGRIEVASAEDDNGKPAVNRGGQVSRDKVNR